MRLYAWKTKPMRSRRISVSCFSLLAADLDVAEEDLTARDAVEPGEAVQQRRLAGTRRAHDRGEHAGAELDADVVERADLGVAGAVDLRDVDGTRDRGSRRRGGGGSGGHSVTSPGRFDRGADRISAGVQPTRTRAADPEGEMSAGAVSLRIRPHHGLPVATAARRTTPSASEEHDDAHPRVDPQRSDGVRRIDAHLLEHEARRGVAHAVQREQLELLEPDVVVDPDEHEPEREAVERLVEKRRVERLVLRCSRRDASPGRSRAPTATSSGRRTAPG